MVLATDWQQLTSLERRLGLNLLHIRVLKCTLTSHDPNSLNLQYIRRLLRLGQVVGLKVGQLWIFLIYILKILHDRKVTVEKLHVTTKDI